MTRKASIPFDFSIRDELLKDPKNAAIYLEGCLEDGNMELFQEALKNVAKAQGGMAVVAAETKLNRESLYRALSKKGNPKMDTITKVLGAMGMRISIVPETNAHV
ncbi:MAG: putative addiction module antidote protein [Candidatus Pacebacteria bacterium]|nr:putative addiction module antidote protein [Candidatus Paceibacterota bacterium]